MGGVSVADYSTRDVVNALGPNFGLQLTPGTQSVQLLDGTVSVSPRRMRASWTGCMRGLFDRTADLATGYADDQFAMGFSHAQIAAEFIASPEGTGGFRRDEQ